MISKIIWELREDKSIRKVTKLTNRLYANSKASAEYNVISDAILPTDTVQMILSIGDKEYHKLLHYGDILLEDGTKAKGWSIISNGEELALEIENNGYEEMFVSFEIKRFSSLDASVVLKSFTTAQDEVLIYSSDSYTPMVEATDAEVLENEISRINVSLDGKVDKLVNVDTTTGTIDNSGIITIKSTDGTDTSSLIVEPDDVLVFRDGVSESVAGETDINRLDSAKVDKETVREVGYNLMPGGRFNGTVTNTFNTSGIMSIKSKAEGTNNDTVGFTFDSTRSKVTYNKTLDTTYNGEVATHPYVDNKSTADRLYVDEKIESVKKAVGYVFDTYNNFFNWIEGTYVREDGITVNDLIIGDDIFIVEEGVPDYWVKSKSSPMTIADFAPYESGDYKPTITWLEG